MQYGELSAYAFLRHFCIGFLLSLKQITTNLVA